ncbi:ABC transporter permease [Rhodoferax fermentans]|uniref:ABC transporter permease n=1 Tax=Rhodoferax fermentans TaxID=28066 RepID=A0A1T1ASC3_RHOFE|nr:ABC transporter permease [Rhodoferax fermentans]MBK1684397.1 ABC transporter permease [Rhodoferax fermentans]OOV06878.1 ABC transporter permease [Rhodoferax fermentans]
MIPLARKTLVYEWRRFVPAVFAVGFSGLLLVVQAALVLGIFDSAAIYVKASTADLWTGYPGTQSVNFGRTISPDVEVRLRMDPSIAAVEPYQWVDGDWHSARAGEGGISVYLSGIRTAPDGMLFARLITRWQREALREPGAVLVDWADLDALGVQVDQTAWINGHRVRVVAAVDGLRGLGGINVLASLDTARKIGGVDAASGTTYLVARTLGPAQATQAHLAQEGSAGFGPFEVWTAEQFALRSQHYWMFDTGAGVAVLFMAIVVCLVGTVVTSQSLMAVVAGTAREYAVLNALGASRAALARLVIEQACWIGGLGLVLAGVASAALLGLASVYGVPVAMTPAVAVACALLIGLVALFSGIFAVRGLLRAEPALLLR